VQAILRRIVTGQYRGGDRLVEEELALTIGVSRTPVREALGELAGIGMIGLKPNQGAVVRPFGPAQLREMYQIRRILEAQAARLAAGRINGDRLLEIRQGTQDLLHADLRTPSWSLAAVALDQEVHEMVSAGCGSARLAEEIGRYRGLVQSLREAVGNTAHALDSAQVEHTAIIDRLYAGDGDGAALAMARHIDRGTDRAVSALFTTGRWGHAVAVDVPAAPRRVAARRG
jgi:DNA-binding GntR family transcriptional regulator